MKKMSRRIVGGFAAASLSLALVACSEAEDAADSAGDVAASATDAAAGAVDDGDAVDDGESVDGAGAADDQVNDEDADADADADGAEMATIATADGEAEVPAEFASAIEDKTGEWGEVQNIEEGDNGSVATFENGDLLVYSEDHGAQPVVGKIAETWQNEGGLDAEVGLPTAAEQDATEGTGWTQDFTDGTISWLQDDSGEFSAEIA